MVYLFVSFVEEVFEQHVESGSKIQIDLEMLRLSVNGNTCLLEPGPLGGFGRTGVKQAPTETYLQSATYNHKEDIPERIAMLLISDVYAWFGFEEDRVPYTTKSSTGLIIDKDALISGG